MVNEAMRIERENHLGAKHYERREERRGHANDYNPKTVKTLIGEVVLCLPY
jgi:transposase-like protein